MKDCTFNIAGRCVILRDTMCSKDCKFYKTIDQFLEADDAAIMVCRKKGLCKKCKYRLGGEPCKLSTEVRYKHD